MCKSAEDGLEQGGEHTTVWLSSRGFPEARLREDTSLLWTVAAHSLQAFPMNCSIYSIWIIRIQPATSLSRDGKRAQTIHACGFASCSREPQTPTSVVPFLWTPKIAKWQRTRKLQNHPATHPAGLTPCSSHVVGFGLQTKSVSWPAAGCQGPCSTASTEER